MPLPGKARSRHATDVTEPEDTDLHHEFLQPHSAARWSADGPGSLPVSVVRLLLAECLCGKGITHRSAGTKRYRRRVTIS
ncbi:hypothetical protein C791_6128 [Amycolatopsis azurea DSM 43854]|uniref:Uncharacterized protein n=1 Tax=Amycolatopsis azurea DSM 43854 TaxID=1238180 RepID=M2QAT3_9PSEU|nr:hypothetical protein C791_6128 [Amycolatopsis azurea DSM 43854]